MNRALALIEEVVTGARARDVIEAVGKELFHTTSFAALPKILSSMQLKPREGFISFSEVPWYGDIRSTDATLVFALPSFKSQLLKVDYSPDWYERYKEQAAYIAGEGWREQFTLDDYVSEDDIDPETGDIDPDVEEAAYDDAQYAAFEAKSEEREWVTKNENQSVKFDAASLLRIIVRSPSDVEHTEQVMRKLGLQVLVKPLARARSHRAA